jgi:hypothetical protein
MGSVLERRMHSKEEINDGKRFLATIAGEKTFLGTTGLWCNKSYQFPFAVGVVSEKGIWYPQVSEGFGSKWWWWKKMHWLSHLKMLRCREHSSCSFKDRMTLKIQCCNLLSKGVMSDNTAVYPLPPCHYPKPNAFHMTQITN